MVIADLFVVLLVGKKPQYISYSRYNAAITRNGKGIVYARREEISATARLMC